MYWLCCSLAVPPIHRQENLPHHLPQIPLKQPIQLKAATPLIPITHKHSATEVVAATCTAEGYTVYVCDCGDTYNDDFTEKAEHTYEETVIPPTAESEGYTLYMCTVCNHAYKDSKISAADFIAKIDIYHEYPDFAHKKETPPTGDSTFREKVKRDLNFDPNRHYEDMMFLELRLDENGLPEDGAKWIVQTAQEQRDADRAGDTSLVEQIEKLPKKKPE